MQDEDPQFTKTLLSRSRDGEREAEPEPEDQPTETLAAGESIGRYRIRERIGEGGMGVVYAAEDRELGRVVAIKLLHSRYGAEAESHQRRLLREAQALAKVSHRNLVMVFDVGSHRGRVWLAMEYVAGDTLEEWLARERRTWAEIVGVMAEAGRGLAAVHAAGLVHRDFKPGNVVVRKDGTVQVLDFGLAVRIGDEEDRKEQQTIAAPDLDALAANLTTTGAFMGTPAYMAPEQFMMRPTDGRADQFALCVALYEALYGHRPFKGRDIAELMSRTLEGLPGLPPEMPGLPLSVRQVIARGLAKNPDDRYPNMEALVAALEATRSPERESSGGWRRFAAGMAVGVGGLAVAFGIWLASEDDEAAASVPPAPIAIEPTPTQAKKKPERPPPKPEPPPVVEEPPPAVEEPPPAVEEPPVEPTPDPAVVEEPREEDPSPTRPSLPRPSTDPQPDPQPEGGEGPLPSVHDGEDSSEPADDGGTRPSSPVEVEPAKPDDPPAKDPDPDNDSPADEAS